MTTVNNGDVIRCDVIGDFNGSDMLAQVYQFKLVSGGPLDGADVLDDLAEIFSDIWDIIKTLHHAYVVFRKVRGQLMPDGDILGERAYGTPKAGTSADQTASTTVTAPLSFLTTTPRVVLRKSIGPIAENQVGINGLLAGGCTTLLASLGAFLLTGIVATNGVYEYGYLSPKVMGWIAPNSAVVATAPGTMARRRIGRGA